MPPLSQMTIAALERETGLGKDTLRVWERRYGFPQPSRNSNGERLYPAGQVERLRLIKRLMDQGHRPGRLFAAGEAELQVLLTTISSPAPAVHSGVQEDVRKIIALLKSYNTQELRQTLHHTMMRQGLQQFVLGTLVSLAHAVGEAWMRGEIEIFEEHHYSEQIKALLRQALANLPAGTYEQPSILLTTVPEEEHALGLLMAECLLTMDGARCISLGTQTPLLDIQLAAKAHRADIVALSFSSAFPARKIASVLKQLRELLPPEVQLWAGGVNARKIASINGVIAVPTLEDALAKLHQERTREPDSNSPAVAGS